MALKYCSCSHDGVFMFIYLCIYACKADARTSQKVCQQDIPRNFTSVFHLHHWKVAADITEAATESKITLQ